MYWLNKLNDKNSNVVLQYTGFIEILSNLKDDPIFTYVWYHTYHRIKSNTCTHIGATGVLTYIDNDARIKINEDGRKYSRSPLPWQKLFKMKNVNQMRFFKLYFIKKK